MTRFALFVDGSNLYGSLRNMNLLVDDYQTFYRHVFDEAVSSWRDVTGALPSCPAELRRVYWYAIGSIDEWDLTDPKAQAHLRERFEGDRSAQRVYMALAGQKLHGESQGKIATEAWALCFKDFEGWYEKKRQIVDGMRRFHHAVEDSTDLIDIIRCGHWKVDFMNRSLTEKGLDTRLAVDMVALSENYDVALVLSGDADSIPSINYLKTRNKHIAAVEFVSGYPPDKRGRNFSSRLKLVADFVVRIYEMDLVTNEVARKPDPHHREDTTEDTVT